jgi:hypothetical protein
MALTLCHAALAAFFWSAVPASSRVIPRKACALDTTPVATAMASVAALSPLNARIDDDFHRLLVSARNLDGRYILGTIRAEWLCGVARRCGNSASPETRMGQCLRDAMLQRARELEGLLRQRRK